VASIATFFEFILSAFRVQVTLFAKVSTLSVSKADISPRGRDKTLPLCGGGEVNPQNKNVAIYFCASTR